MYARLLPNFADFFMSEAPGKQSVYVDVQTNVVITDFAHPQKQSPIHQRFFVSVQLTDADLEQTGESFVNAVRTALKEILMKEGSVMVYKDGPVSRSPISQILGFRVNPDALTITGQWRPKPSR